MILQFIIAIIMMLIIVFMFAIVGRILDKLIYKIQIKIACWYVRGRTAYYKMKLKSFPDNEKYKDKYERSRNHANITLIQNYMVYLTDRYGHFEICPMCHLPRIPDRFGCSACNKIEQDKFDKFYNNLHQESNSEF